MQVAYLKWFRMQYPGITIFAIPNGAQRSYKNACFLKAEGMLAGVCDLFCLAARGEWHGLFLEMKIYPNEPSDAQLRFIKEARKAGYKAEVCYTIESAISITKDYMNA